MGAGRADRRGAGRREGGERPLPAGRGGGVPLHYHNCDEQTTVLEGEAEAEIDGRRFPMRPYDTAFIPEGKHHCFRNVGE